MTKFNQISERFGSRILATEQRNSKRMYIRIASEDIVPFATFLFGELHFRFIIISGVDLPEGIELLYHFSDDSDGAVYTLRALTSGGREHPHIPTLSNLIIGASWIEREVHELLGVEFTGHPNLKHLLLPEDWPLGKFPLRRDYE